MSEPKIFVDDWSNPKDKNLMKWNSIRCDQSDIDSIKIGDMVKICGNNEAFWTIVTELNDNYIIGKIDNDLILEHEYKAGDLVKYERSHVHDAATPEIMTDRSVRLFFSQMLSSIATNDINMAKETFLGLEVINTTLAECVEISRKDSTVILEYMQIDILLICLIFNPVKYSKFCNNSPELTKLFEEEMAK